MREDDATHEALKLMGQSIGIVSLGRKIVLIEGEHGSLDKQTYGAILRGSYPDLVLVPSGGKGLIQSFSGMLERVINQSVWGVEFFMLCDRDAIPAHKDVTLVESKGNGRIKVLERYHLENYFLEEDVIADVFSFLEPEGSWLRSPDLIRARLVQIAKEYLSYSCALLTSAHFREQVGNIDIMPKACHGKNSEEVASLITAGACAERKRVISTLCDEDVQRFVSDSMRELEASFNSGLWKNMVPGRVMLKVFCSPKHANLDYGRFKVAYLNSAFSERVDDPFQDVRAIFGSFSTFN